MLDIREALRFTQEQMRDHLRVTLGVSYSTTRISKMEGGESQIRLSDIDAFARVDPQQRGREWLAWGNVLPRGNPATPGITQQKGPSAKRSIENERRKREASEGDRSDLEGPSQAS